MMRFLAILITGYINCYCAIVMSSEHHVWFVCLFCVLEYMTS